MNDPDFRPLAFLVDLDGVLVQSHELHLAAYERALRRHGLELGPDARELVRGGADRGSVLAGAAVPEALVAEVSEEKEAAFVDLLDDGRLLPSTGAERFLRELRAADCPAALVSNSATAERCVESLGLAWAFGVVVGPEAVSRAKPDPEPFLRAASLLEVAPERCVAVEDSPAGAASARAAGTFVVGVGGRLGAGDVDLLVPDLAGIPVRRWLRAVGPSSGSEPAS